MGLDSNKFTGLKVDRLVLACGKCLINVSVDSAHFSAPSCHRLTFLILALSLLFCLKPLPPENSVPFCPVSWLQGLLRPLCPLGPATCVRKPLDWNAAVRVPWMAASALR